MLTSTVEVADRVWVVPVVPGVNVVVVKDDDGVTLIDTAFAGATGRLIGGLRRLGVGPGQLTRILLTHCHPDHAGTAQALRDQGAGPVLVGRPDLATVRGDAPQPESDRRTTVGRIFNALPAVPYPSVPDADAIDEATTGEVGGGCDVIATPGHTPGHVAYHLHRRGVIVGGDVVFNVFKLRPSPGFLCADVPRNRDSIERLAGVDHRTLVLAHGSPITDDPQGRLRTLLGKR